MVNLKKGCFPTGWLFDKGEDHGFLSQGVSSCEVWVFCVKHKRTAIYGGIVDNLFFVNRQTCVRGF
jgi:hypothetical protein